MSFNVVTDVRVVPLIPDEGVNENDLKFKGFDTNFNSVTLFGKAKEVVDQEKLDGLCALLKKFLDEDTYSKYKEAGIKYIERSFQRTKVIKIVIERMTGKRGIKEHKQIPGKQQ